MFFPEVFCVKSNIACGFVLFYAMNLSRCVVITLEEHVWANILPYLSKKKEEYNWIPSRPKDSEKLPNDKVGVFVWWSKERMFSATPLRSYLKRLKKKGGVNQNKECFRISRSVKTKSILKKLVQSAKTPHSWDDCYIGKELSEYLETGVLRLKKLSESKATKQPSMEVADQQSEPSTSQQTDQQPSTSQQSEPQQVEPQQANPSRFGESVTKDIADLSSKVDKVTDTSRMMSTDIRRAIQSSNLNVRIVERPQSSLKQLLVESRPYDKVCTDTSKCPICSNSNAPVRCTQKDVVYQINCDLCGATYVGETGRPLVVRYQEHFRSAANPNAKSYKNMAFSKHYLDQHYGQKPKLSVKILKRTKGSVERKITEALFIQKLNPDLNGKYEQLNVLDFLV